MNIKKISLAAAVLAAVVLFVALDLGRYLSLDESAEQESVRELCGVPGPAQVWHGRRLLERMTGKEGPELMDDFMTFTDYSARGTLAERLKTLKGPRHGNSAGVYYEQLLDTVRNLNRTLIRNNISHGRQFYCPTYVPR